MPPGPDLVGSDVGVDGLIKNMRAAKSEVERSALFDKAIVNSDIFLTARA